MRFGAEQPRADAIACRSLNIADGKEATVPTAVRDRSRPVEHGIQLGKRGTNGRRPVCEPVQDLRRLGSSLVVEIPNGGQGSLRCSELSVADGVEVAFDHPRGMFQPRLQEPLVAMADLINISVLGLIHHNKSGATDPLQVVMASKAFPAMARSVHTVIPDPDDDTSNRRLFGTPKNNLGRIDLPTLSFVIESFALEVEDGTASTGRLVWGDESKITINEAMRRSAESPDEKSATVEAAEWPYVLASPKRQP
jgi:hypothetical protein